MRLGAEILGGCALTCVAIAAIGWTLDRRDRRIAARLERIDKLFRR